MNKIYTIALFVMSSIICLGEAALKPVLAIQFTESSTTESLCLSVGQILQPTQVPLVSVELTYSDKHKNNHKIYELLKETLQPNINFHVNYTYSHSYLDLTMTRMTDDVSVVSNIVNLKEFGRLKKMFIATQGEIEVISNSSCKYLEISTTSNRETSSSTETFPSTQTSTFTSGEPDIDTTVSSKSIVQTTSLENSEIITKVNFIKSKTSSVPWTIDPVTNTTSSGQNSEPNLDILIILMALVLSILIIFVIIATYVVYREKRLRENDAKLSQLTFHCALEYLQSMRTSGKNKVYLALEGPPYKTY